MLRKKYLCQKNIKKGERLTNKNLCIKGPVAGLKPKYIDIILNRKAKKVVNKDEPITWEIF